MNVIETRQLKKVYNPDTIPVKAVDDVYLEIGKGEFTALVGPSGCGKTTLLNLIGGLDEPTSGGVNLNGVDLSGLSQSALTDFRLMNVGFVFQSYNLIPVLTAKENIEFILLLQQANPKKREERVRELLVKMGLEEQTNRRPSEMSGGQQQRVAVARALASSPKVILADEPTANLDSTSTTDLLDIMSRMNQDEGVTFLFSTHDQRVIDRAKRVITLEDGRVKSDETI